MSESIKTGNEQLRLTTEEWRELTSPEKFVQWLESNQDIISIISSTAEDGREGKFFQIMVDGETIWLAAEDGTVLEEHSISFWGLTR